MKLTSREISKELHNAGFKGEPCGGYYVEGGFTITLNPKPKADYLAYDLETIIEALPKVLDGTFYGKNLQICYRAMITLAEFRYISHQDKLYHVVRQIDGENIADTAARLWLKLKQDNLLLKL